jgi:hypothetical protein
MHADKSVLVIDENPFKQPRFLTHLCSALRTSPIQDAAQWARVQGLLRLTDDIRMSMKGIYFERYLSILHNIPVLCVNN